MGSLYLIGAAVVLSSIISSGSSCPDATRCIGSSNYCSGSYKTGATCVNGTCQCPNNPMRDRCSCLLIIGGCHIRKADPNAAASATFRGSPPRYGYTTYSCVANNNCNSEVHVIGNYEGNGQHGFGVSRTTGRTNLYLTVTGSSSRPLILVLSSYEPVRWTLHIPGGVVIDRVIISSYYSNSVVYPPGQVLATENTLRYSAFGSDSGGGSTRELLTYLNSRFGPVSSFTGTYQADVWRLNIHRSDPDATDCLSGPSQSPIPPIPTTRTRITIPTPAASTITTLTPQLPPAHSIIGSCQLRSNSPNAAASATFRGSPPRYGYTTYSCVANDNCNNEVHVIGNYEGNGQHGIGIRRTTGRTNLYLTVTGSSSRPLILVLSSYEPVQWTLHIPRGVVIDRLIISSYYNNTAVYPSGQVLAVENNLRLFSYGSDSGGGDTRRLLCIINDRFGPISSLTGTYQADVWRLSINRRDPDRDCLSIPTICGSVQDPDPDPGNTNTGHSANVPRAAWYGIGFSFGIFFILITVIFYVFRRYLYSRRLRTRSRFNATARWNARATATTTTTTTTAAALPSFSAAYPSSAPPATGVSMRQLLQSEQQQQKQSLSSAMAPPPSYDDVAAGTADLPAPPPAYSTLQPQKPHC